MYQLTYKIVSFYKFSTFLFLIIYLLFPMCVEGQIRTNDASKILNLLEGEWDWICTVGGWTGKAYITPEIRGYTLKYDFRKIKNCNDSVEYYYYKNDTLVANLKAKFSYFNNLYGANYWYFDYLYGETGGNNLIFGFETADTLYFAENGFDGFGYKYAKGIKSEVKENSQKEYIFYPNPTNGIIYISGSDKIKNIQILNQSGGMLYYSGKIENCILDLNFLPDGIYIFKLNLSNSLTINQKIILQR
ncbi:MAG: T9SS type A sorting domain-containing protein [Prolixibacteraceae bacterium]|nr:T9SS type A sorting domain-containing protein [Prolixibacteraceae bacterium]